jgi:uncharacterized delta-60 repeat protein
LTGASGVVLQPQSNGLPKIVVAGSNNSGFELARYNANGTLDKTFGPSGTGTVYTSIGSGFSTGNYHCLAQEPNGDLIVVGYTGSQGVLAVYSANGTLDPPLTYNSAFNEVGAVAIYPATDPTNGGKIVVAGSGAQEFALARYTLNTTNNTLALDQTFGTGGVVTTAIGNGAAAWAVAIQSDGKVVAGGLAAVNGTRYAALTRYNPDGRLDSTFGTGGIVTTEFATVSSVIHGLAIQPDGAIVACGNTAIDSAVARYLPSEPEVGSFTASPNPVTSGSSTTLTASNITDGNPNSTITQVTFYYFDSSGNKVTLGTGTPTQTSPGVWTFTFTWTVTLAPGTYTLYAQAEDSYDVFGDPFALTLTVTPALITK